MIDYKELYDAIEDFVDENESFLNKNFEELEEYREEYKKYADNASELIENTDDIHEQLSTLADSWSYSELENSGEISNKFEEIKKLLSEASFLVNKDERRKIEEYDEEFAEQLDYIIDGIEELIDGKSEFITESLSLESVADLLRCFMMDENMKDVDAEQGTEEFYKKNTWFVLTSYNAEDVMEFMVNKAKARCELTTKGLLVRFGEDGEAEVIVPFGTKVDVIENNQPTLFDIGKDLARLTFEWGNSTLEVYGTEENPCVGYTSDNNARYMDISPTGYYETLLLEHKSDIINVLENSLEEHGMLDENTTYDDVCEFYYGISHEPGFEKHDYMSPSVLLRSITNTISEWESDVFYNMKQGHVIEKLTEAKKILLEAVEVKEEGEKEYMEESCCEIGSAEYEEGLRMHELECNLIHSLDILFKAFPNLRHKTLVKILKFVKEYPNAVENE